MSKLFVFFAVSLYEGLSSNIIIILKMLGLIFDEPVCMIERTKTLPRRMDEAVSK